MHAAPEHRLLRALRREPVDRTPIWLMRQAGRYLPEYRATRARAGSFLNLMRNPELAAEVTLQPLARYPLDAAILFSDILTIPDAMGLGLRFAEGEGPHFDHPVRDARTVRALRVPEPEQALRYVLDTVRLLTRELAGRVPLIGFTGSPWTLATYAVEGGPSADFRIIKGLLYGEPETLHALLDVLTRGVIAHLAAQAHAGAQALMVFDTWGGVLTAAGYREFSLRYLAQIVAALKDQAPGVPVVLYGRGAGTHLDALAGTGCACVGVDWTVDLAAAREIAAGRVAIQGNLDPVMLLSAPAAVRAEAQTLLARWGTAPGHIFNLGHGVLPQTDPDTVAALVAAVQAGADTVRA